MLRRIYITNSPEKGLTEISDGQRCVMLQKGNEFLVDLDKLIDTYCDQRRMHPTILLEFCTDLCSSTKEFEPIKRNTLYFDLNEFYIIYHSLKYKAYGSEIFLSQEDMQKICSKNDVLPDFQMSFNWHDIKIRFIPNMNKSFILEKHD